RNFATLRNQIVGRPFRVAPAAPGTPKRRALRNAGGNFATLRNQIVGRPFRVAPAAPATPEGVPYGRPAHFRNIAKSNRRATLQGTVFLEPQPNLQLQVTQGLRAGGGAEPRVPGCQSRRVDRAVRKRLRIDDREIRRAPVDDVPLAIVVNDDVEHVERVETELEIAAATEADVPGDGEVDGVVGAPTEDETPRLHADAAV